MRTLIDCLPGLPMSVAEVTHTVRHMWDQATGSDAAPMSEFRASQMNLVLHFGLKTTETEAKGIFDTAIAFAQRYPCRIIVLAPFSEENVVDDSEPLAAKLFSQCYVGSNLRELCCCEALMLSYPVETASLITHAVSLWLETDLPIYHWFHRVPRSRIEDEYQIYLHRSSRVLFDREVDGDAYDGLHLGEGVRMVDLAVARTLPVRQNLGQFLSNFRPARLIDGLKTVRLEACAERSGEGRILVGWMKKALRSCASQAGIPCEALFELGAGEADSCCVLKLEWTFEDPERFLRWTYDQEAQTGFVSCNFGQGEMQHPVHIENLVGAAALSEALFFTTPESAPSGR